MIGSFGVLEILRAPLADWHCVILSCFQMVDDDGKFHGFSTGLRASNNEVDQLALSLSVVSDHWLMRSYESVRCHLRGVYPIKMPRLPRYNNRISNCRFQCLLRGQCHLHMGTETWALTILTDPAILSTIIQQAFQELDF